LVEAGKSVYVESVRDGSIFRLDRIDG
jgi:hypothetical protein